MHQVYSECTFRSTQNRPLARNILYSPRMTIGKRLKELRQGAGLTQEALGELFGTPEKPEGFGKATVSAWEQDRNQLTASQIILICKRFRVSPDYLLLGTTTDEIELLTDYRGASERAKTAIRMAAKTSERS